MLALTQVLSILLGVIAIGLLFSYAQLRSRRGVEVIVLMCFAHALIVGQIEARDPYVDILSAYWVLNLAGFLYLHGRTRNESRRIVSSS